MSLLRLLTAGKSLVGLKEGPGRYKETSARLLPKFGGKKNPFRAGSAVSGGAGPQPATVSSAEECPGSHGPVTFESQAPAVTRPSTEAPKCEAASEGAREETRMGQWTKKLTSLFAARTPAPKRAVPEFKAPVQTELSLDRVKVVRNDLSDTDLEIVVAKAPAAPKTVAAPTGKSAGAAAVKAVAEASVEAETPGETCGAVRSAVS